MCVGGEGWEIPLWRCSLPPSLCLSLRNVCSAAMKASTGNLNHAAVCRQRLCPVLHHSRSDLTQTKFGVLFFLNRSVKHSSSHRRSSSSYFKGVFDDPERGPSLTKSFIKCSTLTCKGSKLILKSITAFEMFIGNIKMHGKYSYWHHFVH